MSFSRFLLLFIAGIISGAAAAPDRITMAVNSGQTRSVPGHLLRLAQAQYDRGPLGSSARLDYVVVLLRPSAKQQTELDRLLQDQQNPSSPLFRKWVTPEDFGNRFGLSVSDHSKVAAWLTSEGLTVQENARGRNWIAFGGTAAQMAKSLRTAFHRFDVNGASHFANITEPSVPEALADVIGGFLGLNDFYPESHARPVRPEYNVGSSHFLVPDDFATIYNVKPLYQAGLDGSGQSIAVVGQSDVLISDIRAFRSRYNLPANDPTLMPYGPDPGYNGAQIEGNLDLEWAGAIAPKAALYYIYGPSAFTATISAVNSNVAKIISISYGACEIDFAPSYYRSVAQQANAQGITIVNSSGDSGAAGCDGQGVQPFASRGRSVDFPAVMPEVTGVGGTQFVEGSGIYWAASNNANFGSALSYIPEAAWNESATLGLLSGGGGGSLIYPKPAWQAGPGVPPDNVRHVPDLAFSAALHDAYFIYYQGANGGVAGTSASTPSFAGIVALLNQYQIINKFQSQPGLGNINPQLYRLAQSAPSAFHDVTAGDNSVRCVQGSVDCDSGSFGYAAGRGYDEATGLGSVDANNLVTQWNSATNDAAIVLSTSAIRATVNDPIRASVTLTAAAGTGVPTGSVDFGIGFLALGSVPLAPDGTAALSFPLYRLGTGTFVLSAVYSGDAAFSSRGATTRVQVTLPVGAAAIVVSGPSVVWPQPADAQGLSWQTTLSLREAAGVPALITAFAVDGNVQPLSQYFPSPNIPASSTVTTSFVFRGFATPQTRIFGFTGVDADGNTWSRQLSVDYFSIPDYSYFNLTATPLTVSQNTSVDPGCQWPVQLNVDDQGGGALSTIAHLYAGGVDLTRQIPAVFGTTRIDPLGGVQGTLCFGGIATPASNVIEVDLSNGQTQQVTVSFAGPPATPSRLSAAPATVSLSSGPAALSVNLSDGAQTWTAAVFPANRTTSWLNLSHLSGTGSGQILLSAKAAGFEPGVYRATIVLQSINAIPQTVNVPVMFVLGGSTSGTSIAGVGNSASGQAAVSPGMILSVFGTNLANTTDTATASPLAYSTHGVSATVDGVAAPVLFVSPNRINLQVPYAVGSGPAVLGINNNGEIAGFAFQIAPASPGIYTDAQNNVVPSATVAQGGNTTLFLNGTGEVSPAVKTAYFIPPNTPPAATPKPLLPLSVTVAGVPAFVQYAGISAGLIGTLQLNIIVPASVPAGVQPVVVTVGGYSSQAAMLLVQEAQ